VTLTTSLIAASAGTVLVTMASGAPSLAVRTLSGKPLAFASFSASAGVRLFVARGCVDDS
jgi:hypothetical protein